MFNNLLYTLEVILLYRQIHKGIKLSVYMLTILGGLLVSVSHATVVAKYDLLELSLTAEKSYWNPYLQMPGNSFSPSFVVGAFIGPNGEKIQIDGFWDGGRVWKIRMAPMAVGIWTYQTSSPDPGLNGNKGSFECIRSESPGFIRIHPQNPYAFVYDDGTPFFWMGDTQVIFYHHNKGDYSFDNGTFQSLQDLRASQGITSLYFGSWLFKKKGNFAQNEGGYNFNKSNPDLLNPSFWQWADKRLQYVVSKGMVPGLGVGWPDQGIASFGDNRLMRALRYMIARYAAYNVMWILFGEADEFGMGWENKVRYFGKTVKKLDPYNHLLSTHVTNRTSPSIGGDSWLDINTEQIAGCSYIIPDRKNKKPVVNLEFGYEGNISPDVLRKRAWGIVCNGGYFQYGDNLKRTTPGRTYCANLAYFFTKETKFWRLDPHSEYVKQGTGYCTAIPGQEYVVYLPSGGRCMVDLLAGKGTFSVAWYNPQSGYYPDKSKIAGGKIASFAPPDPNDWVLHLKKLPGVHPAE